LPPPIPVLARSKPPAIQAQVQVLLGAQPKRPLQPMATVHAVVLDPFQIVRRSVPAASVEEPSNGSRRRRANRVIAPLVRDSDVDSDVMPALERVSPLAARVPTAAGLLERRSSSGWTPLLVLLIAGCIATAATAYMADVGVPSAQRER
jgi:hypothetical protein